MLHWRKATAADGNSEWIVYKEEGARRIPISRATILSEALESAVRKLGCRVLDKSDWPPGKVANFESCSDFVRNVAVLRTALCSLYEEVKALESKLPTGAHSNQDFDVNGTYALLAVKFDWFSVSMLNLMEGISLLDTLAREGSYSELTSSPQGAKRIQKLAREYTKSVPEARALRLWRDKVAAHRSGIHPPPARIEPDSAPTRRVSMMGAQVGAKNRRYVAPSFTPVDSGTGSANHGLLEWSLTETWESLEKERYEWLNNGSFFREVNGISLGEGRSLQSISLISGNESEFREALAKEGINLDDLGFKN